MLILPYFPAGPGGQLLALPPKSETEVHSMASVSQTVSAPRIRIFTGRNSLLDRYFYFAMSLAIVAIVAWGFSHTIDENLLHPAVPRPLILWFHGAAFSLWVLFFIFQSALVRTRNVKWHRFFGWFGAALGTVMVPLGITTAIVMTRFETDRLHETGRALFLGVSFNDVVAFGVFFALAVLWRRKTEFHRRLMYVATCCLLAAAFGRMQYVGPHSLFYVGVDSMVLLGVVRDLLVNRHIHKVYRVALPVMIVCQVFVVYAYLAAPAWWAGITQAIAG